MCTEKYTDSSTKAGFCTAMNNSNEAFYMWCGRNAFYEVA